MSSELLPCPLCGSAARTYSVKQTYYGNRQIVWRIDCTNDNECGVSTGGFASQSAAVAKWNTRCTVYAHRNGETEAPTAPGKYWFDNKKWRDTVDVIASASLLLAFDPHTNRYYDVSDLVMYGKWWGPMVPPWEIRND